MFQSATLKLTGWYLLILMSISIIFSISIFSIASHEVDSRLEQLQDRYEDSGMFESGMAPQFSGYNAFRRDQNEAANTNLFLSLVYVNLMILVVGGVISYMLARRTLRGIEEIHEAQSRFTSDASHELRTPLAVMKSEIEVILRDKNITKAELRETLESNLEEVNKLSNLSYMLLQLSKAGDNDIEMEKLDLKDVLGDVIKRQNQPNTRLSLTTSSAVPYALGNRTSIEELCMILVDNALKYSPPESLVAVKLFKRSGKPCIEVVNTGTGISEDDLPHIFDRFYRADTSRTNSSQSGYGLGLALAKRIVEIHNGELTASSALNHATTFTVLLPIFSKSTAKTQY